MNTSIPAETQHETDSRTQRRPRGLEVSAVLVLLVGWVVLMSRFGAGDVYSVMGPYACVVALVCLALSPRALLHAFACDARGLLLGLGLGVLMTALTYPIFRLAVQLVPSLQPQVAGLYHGAHSTSLGRALAWVVALVVAEEVLFRGELPRALSQFTTKSTAYAASVLTYALAQLGSGSWIVFMLALVCGTVWTMLREYTHSLTPALIAHGIWTPTVILLYPVT